LGVRGWGVVEDYARGEVVVDGGESVGIRDRERGVGVLGCVKRVGAGDVGVGRGGGNAAVDADGGGEAGGPDVGHNEEHSRRHRVTTLRRSAVGEDLDVAGGGCSGAAFPKQGNELLLGGRGGSAATAVSRRGRNDTTTATTPIPNVKSMSLARCFMVLLL